MKTLKSLILAIILVSLCFTALVSCTQKNDIEDPIIDISNLIHIIRELKNVNYEKELKVIETTCVGIILIIALVIATKLFGIAAGGAIAAVTATVTGSYGIVLQLITIPPIVYAVKKGGFIK